MKKKAVIFGAGKIARGFIGQLLYLSDFEITFVDVFEPIVNVLNEKKQYHVHVLGDESLDSDVTGIQAFTYDSKKEIYDEFYKADLAFVSVGGNHLPAAAQSVADIINTYGAQKVVKNIIVCENWKDAAETFKKPLMEALNDENRKIFEEYVGISEAVLMRTATQPDEELAKKYPQDVWVQNFWYLPIDKSRLKGEIPEIKSVELMDHFGNFLTQKMYTNNTSNAVIAYTGYLLGYDILADAANSPEIQKLLDSAYKEINQTLEAELGVDPAQQEAFAKKARASYCR